MITPTQHVTRVIDREGGHLGRDEVLRHITPALGSRRAGLAVDLAIAVGLITREDDNVLRLVRR